MANEQYTESITLIEMKCHIGQNDFGYVFPQGDVSDIDKIEVLLKQAGEKPKHCIIDDYAQGGKGKAKPEYIITFNDDTSTIIVVECKKDVRKHSSSDYSYPKDYAVDGALYYAKHLKNEYNVIAVGISGTKKENMKANAFYWMKGQETYNELLKARDIILEPRNYIKLVKGNKLEKAYSLDEIRETAIDMHNYLREIKVTEAHKPIFIAGILIALNDDDFAKSYSSLPSYKAVMQNIRSAIETVLNTNEIKNSRINYIKQVFEILQDNTKFAEIPLGHSKSITWYIEQLELKIKPMMDYADSTIDALGVFYHEFIKYSGGDGSGLGIVLTPQHLAEFMCDLAEVNKNSRVVDICCGSGSFLVTAMSKMFSQANSDDIERIRRDGLYGIEFDDGLYTLAIANMIIRKDGKSNIYKGDCFNAKIKKELKSKNINVGLINPPYSQTDKTELEFVEQLLDILAVGGTGVAVVPAACAIGTKFKAIRERLMKKHTLKAVFSMPDEIFYPASPCTCVMVWRAHCPHDDTQETFFGFYKYDGFVKKKKLGRVDVFDNWKKIKAEWLSLYRNHKVIDGKTASRCIDCTSEWLCEAYMKTDYSVLSKQHFMNTVRKYLSYEILYNKVNLDPTGKLQASMPLNVSSWVEFPVGGENGIFKLEPCKCKNAGSLEAGDDIAYIGAKKRENGVMSLVKHDDALVSKGNAIVFICDGQGSVGYCNYLESDFIGSTTLCAGYNENLNKYNGLFIVTVLDLERPKYSYGRKYKKTLPSTVIKLPATSEGKPDYKFMENYIKSLPFSDRI
ncbi:MAG: N-6 DNA methylase [Oscillospiraceae bacterium]|nr:N-6 DNA methylase [Oscillospiraceae bacterium]